MNRYSHAIPPQNGASMENKNQNANKKPYHSRFERSIGQMNGNITALTKATSPYLCVAGSSSNSFVVSIVYKYDNSRCLIINVRCFSLF